MKEKFLVIYEHGKRSYSGFAPDVQGCGSTGKTLTEMRRMMKEALEAHIEVAVGDGDPAPKPETTVVDFKELDEGDVDHYVVEWWKLKFRKHFAVPR